MERRHAYWFPAQFSLIDKGIRPHKIWLSANEFHFIGQVRWYDPIVIFTNLVGHTAAGDWLVSEKSLISGILSALLKCCLNENLGGLQVVALTTDSHRLA